MGQFQPPGATPPKPEPTPSVPGAIADASLREVLTGKLMAHDAYAPLRRRVQLYY